jgi:peptidoglycan/LPS O-acetylase OafA/YrhL
MSVGAVNFSTSAGRSNARGGGMALPYLPPYRPDIDGLRAFAVLAVVGYHFFPAWIKGGFVGVDVFFVISGFLIGGILLDSLRDGTFSLRSFYARRVRRIFPALIVVMAASLAFGWFALLPDDYQNLGKHSAGGAGFIANLLFWKEAGYFDVAAERKPLLHLWSLGVEEQFYIFFPLFLWGLWKKNLRLATFLVLLTWASWRWNLATYKKDPAFDFYLPMTRFWELLTGVLLALWERRREETAPMFYRWRHGEKFFVLTRRVFFRDADAAREQGGAFRSFLSLIGMLLLVLALVKAQTVKFPGKQALVPVLGAACLIAAGPKAWANRVLFSLKPAVWIGLVSYPLYLWHWPLLAYARIILGEMPDRTLRIGMVLGAILLAALTYWIVERPIRFGKRARGGKTAALCIFLVIFGLSGLMIHYENGYKDRGIVRKVASEEGKLHAVMQEVRERDPVDAAKADHAAFKAHYGWPDSFPKNGSLFRDVKGKHTTVILGDSHSLHAYYAIADYNAKIGRNTVRMGESWRFHKLSEVYVEGMFDFYANAIKNDLSIDKIFILTQQGGVNEIRQEEIDVLRRPGLKIYWIADNPLIQRNLDNNPLREQLGRFLKVRHPLYPNFLKKLKNENEDAFSFLHRPRAEIFKNYQRYLDILHSRKGVTVIEGAFDAFCTEDVCPFFDENGRPLYWDGNHITYRTGGMRLVEKVLKPYLNE